MGKLACRVAVDFLCVAQEFRVFAWSKYNMVFTHPFCMGEIIRLIRHKTPFLSCNRD